MGNTGEIQEIPGNPSLHSFCCITAPGITQEIQVKFRKNRGEIQWKYRGNTGEIQCYSILSGRFWVSQNCIYSASSQHLEYMRKYRLNIGEIQEKYRGNTREIQEK